MMTNNYSYTPLKEPIPITEQRWPEGTIPLVHTRTMTFMHENYIRDCIKGILMQKTTFPVQVLIHEDASTDKTAEIVREYELKYPHLIKAFYQQENSHTKPDKHQRRAEFSSWRVGKYEALCEGDDYWTDPLKLQKQFNALESHPDCSLCVHDGMKLFPNGKKIPFKVPKNATGYFGVRDILSAPTFAPTASYFFKKEVLGAIPEWKKMSPSGDFLIEMYSQKFGKGYYLKDTMCIYRKFALNSWSSKFRKRNNYNFLLDLGQRKIQVINKLIEEFPEIEEDAFNVKLSHAYTNLAKGFLLSGDFKSFKESMRISKRKAGPDFSLNQQLGYYLRHFPIVLRSLVMIFDKLRSL